MIGAAWKLIAMPKTQTLILYDIVCHREDVH